MCLIGNINIITKGVVTFVNANVNIMEKRGIPLEMPKLDIFYCVEEWLLIGNPCRFESHETMNAKVMRINNVHGKENTPSVSRRIPPTMPPLLIPKFHTVTSMDWATSAFSPADSANAVCSSVAAPPNVNPHKATPTKMVIGDDRQYREQKRRMQIQTY